MDIKLLSNPEQIRAKFLERFVLSWEAFQLEYQDWISQLAERNYPIGIEWYEQSFLWGRMRKDLPIVSMKEALAVLREHKGAVRFLSEGPSCCAERRLLLRDQKYVGFAAEAKPEELADLIEEEWFESYRLAMEDRYNPCPVLPEELYVFDESMEWCVVFTHETTDWESELDDPMKAAESRLCFVCRI